MQTDNAAKRVLVVEDDSGLRELVLKRLRKEGYEAGGASTGAGALELASADPEMVLLMDHLLPDMLARDVVLALRERNLDPRFIVFTGQGDERLAVEMMRLGAFDYLLKGLDMLDLLPRVLERLYLQKDTEKRLADAINSLRESEERFKALHNASFGGIAIHDKGIVLDCNLGLSEMMGYSPDELVGMDGLLLIAEKSREIVMKNILSGYEKPYEAYGLRKSGEEFPMRLEARVVPFRGKMVRSVEFRDLSAEKMAEKKLSDSEQMYKKLTENMKDVIWVIDPHEFKFTYVSPSVKGLRGFTAEEVMESPLEEAFTSAGRGFLLGKINTGMESFLAGKITSDDYFTEEIEQPCKEGSTVWTEAITRFVTNEDTGKVEIHGVSRDITARRKAEREYQTLFHEMVEGFALHEIICDEKGMPIDYRFIAVNPAFERMTGLRADEITGKTVLEVLPGTEEYWIKTYGRVALTGEPAIFDDFSREVGRHFSVTAFRPEPGQFACIFIDVTEIKKAEESLKEALERLRRVTGSVIRVIVAAVESRDPYTAGHQKRVGDLARAIATEMCLTDHEVEGIRIAGVIHDLGKISVPAEILSKPRKLNEMEFALVKEHPQIGYEILKGVDFDWPVAEMVHQHHERIDGSGYPMGLKGEEIILGARIIAVADVVEAMASHRPYRANLGIEEALKEITSGRGVIYDPVVVDACLRLFEKKQYRLVSQ
jgi:PAS domain S-box-containing protein